MLSQIENELQTNLNFDQVSWIKLKNPVTIDFYKKWLNQDYYGNMYYLKEHSETKSNPQKLNSEFKSIITITQSYFPTQEPIPEPHAARIALYAKNKDYHFWLKTKLNSAIEFLQKKYPNEIFTPYIDSSPILEKDYAYQAGHGWFGKNTCLIHPKKGSLFFIAEILTSVEIKEEDKTKTSLTPMPDMCGTCTRCIDICPTQAILSPRNIKADQCISYLTIESKTVPPLELRSKINDWFFGCDLCQTVCPWNEKVFRTDKISKTNEISTEKILPLTETEDTELKSFFSFILSASNNEIQKKMTSTALFRSRGFGLKRNALIVIANRKMTGLEDLIKPLLKDPKLGELAEWVLRELGTRN